MKLKNIKVNAWVYAGDRGIVEVSYDEDGSNVGNSCFKYNLRSMADFKEFVIESIDKAFKNMPFKRIEIKDNNQEKL